MPVRRSGGATAGYSGTPLPKKLGVNEGSRVTLVNAPDGFERELGALPKGAVLTAEERGPILLGVLFVRDASTLERRLPALVKRLEPAGALWVAWPKKASGVATDLTFTIVQRAGLDAGLVDTKICAVDEVWSGLKFVWRVKDRARVAARKR